MCDEIREVEIRSRWQYRSSPAAGFMFAINVWMEKMSRPCFIGRKAAIRNSAVYDCFRPEAAIRVARIAG